MDFKEPISITEIAARYGCIVVGDSEAKAYGINEIHKVRKGDITFVDVEKYYNKSIHSEASIILINKNYSCPEGKTLLICDDPFDVYDDIIWQHRPFRPLLTDRGVNVHIGQNATIESGVHIGHDVYIGNNAYIQAGTYIGDYTRIEDNVTIQAGALIGTDAFYFKKKGAKYIKWRSGGHVHIASDVEIGAGCTINRGVSGITFIGRGTKLDCLIHVGHGVVIGENCMIAAQVGIAGKTIIGDRCVIYGQVGIAQALTIGDDSVILAKSGVSKNLDGKSTYFGYPAGEAREEYKKLAILRNML